MCYSPEASFAVGSALAIIGIASIKKALQYNRSMLAFSLFPAIFSFHQFIEGFVWLSIDGAFDGKIFRYLYILIAVLLWPFLTPLASALADPEPRRKSVRLMLFAAGLVLTGYLAFKLATASGIEVKVVGHSLSYVIGYDPSLPMFVHLAYAAIAIIPLITLPNPAIIALGVAVGAGFLYTFYEMKEVWYSVWCLTAALFSALVFFSIRTAAPERL